MVGRCRDVFHTAGFVVGLGQLLKVSCVGAAILAITLSTNSNVGAVNLAEKLAAYLQNFAIRSACFTNTGDGFTPT
jgi:hypothetical protein